jgi:uncharacterized protein with HEPN domain
MSDRERQSRAWRFYVEDMIGFCQKIGDYTAGLDKDTFVASAMPYDATLRNLELIGEAATHIPETVRDAHPEIPWREIVGTRNRLIHAYPGIDNDIVCNDVPALLPALRTLLDTTDDT